MKEQYLNEVEFRMNSTEHKNKSHFKIRTFGDISIGDVTLNIPEKIQQMDISEKKDLKLIDIYFIPRNQQVPFNVSRSFYDTKSQKKSNKILPFLKLNNKSNKIGERNKENNDQFKKLIPESKYNRKCNVLKTAIINKNKEETFLTNVPIVEKMKKHKSVNYLKNYYVNKNNDLIEKKIENSEKVNRNKLSLSKNEYNLTDKIIFNKSSYEKEEQDNDENIYKLLNKNKKLLKYLKEKKKELKTNKNKRRNQNKINYKRNADYIRSNTVNDINSLINKNTNKLTNKLTKTTEPNSFNETKNNNNIKNLRSSPLNLKDIGNSTTQIFNQDTTDNTNNIFNSNKKCQKIKKLYYNKLLKNTSSNVYHNSLIDINDLLSELDIKTNPVYLKDIKNKTKFKKFLCYYKIMAAEKGINEKFENNNDDIYEIKNRVIKMKNKCKIILNELDKNNNFNLERIVKEFKKSELAKTSKDYFNDFDKKFTPNNFEVKTESKEQPDDVKYCNFIKRHHYFKKIVNDNFFEGVQANKLVESFIEKSKSKCKK